MMQELEGRIAEAMSSGQQRARCLLHRWRTGFTWEHRQLSMETAGKTENLGMEVGKWIYPTQGLADVLF